MTYWEEDAALPTSPKRTRANDNSHTPHHTTHTHNKAHLSYTWTLTSLSREQAAISMPPPQPLTAMRRAYVPTLHCTGGGVGQLDAWTVGWRWCARVCGFRGKNKLRNSKTHSLPPHKVGVI